MEYCIFQTGLFMDYFAHPYSQAKYLHTFPPLFDLENCRVIVTDDGSQPMVLTTINDVTKVIARAIDYTEPWPVVGGMVGTKTTTAELIRIGEKIRGQLVSQTASLSVLLQTINSGLLSVL